MKTKHLRVIWICLISCILGIIIGYFLRFHKTNKISQAEIFEKNIECQKYLETFKESFSNTFYDGYRDMYTDFGIFYSPIENTCLGYYYSDYYNDYHLIDGEDTLIKYSRNIVTLFGGLKKSTYTCTNRCCKNPEETFDIKSDFKQTNDKGTRCNTVDLGKMWEQEIEWLKGN